MLDIKQIIKELFAEKTRIILTILALAWGTASIASILAIGEGLRLGFGKAMAGEGKAILVIRGGQTTKAYQGQATKQPVNLTEQDLQLIKKAFPEITHISAEYQSQHKMQYQKKSRSGSVLAVDTDYGYMRNIIPQPNGRFIDAIDAQQATRVIVLGNKVANQLFSVSEHPIGHTILIDNIPFLVIGIMQDKMQMGGYIWPQDNMQSWIPATTYRALTKTNKLNSIVVLPSDPTQMDRLKKHIQKIIAINHQLDPTDEGILQFYDTATSQQKVSSFFTGMELFLGIVGGLTLIIAGVGIANVMFASVKKATREIGIRMAVGAQTHQILLHYIFEALLAAAIGGFIGFIIAWCVVKVIGLIPISSDILIQMGKPKPVLSLTVIIIVMVTLGLVGFLAGFFPARKASLINPAEALRHD